MGFLAPAMPWIIQGAGMLGGALAGKKSQSNAMKRSPEEQQALTGAQGIAGAAGKTGQQLLGQGGGYMGQAGNYYSTLLGGNRAAMSQAVAAPMAQLTDTYRGAERGLVRSGLQGAQRDTAMGELNRQRASQIGSLVTGVQPAAAGALGALGGHMTQTGSSLTGTAGTLYSNLLGHGFENRKYARGEGEKTGKAIGGLAAEIGKWAGGKLGKKGGGIPTSPSDGNYGAYFEPE